MQLERMPAQTSLLEGYADAQSTDYLAEEVGQRATARITLAQIERHRSPGTLLDVGCWLGFLLDEARVRGWRGVGLEPSQFASGHARDQLGLDIRQADLFGADLEPQAFDAVVMEDVLEHLPEPGAALDRVAGLIRSGGVLHLALPDAGSRLAGALGPRWWSVIPTHIHYFTRGSLRLLLESRGWKVLEVTTAPKAFTVGYYLGRLGGYSRPLARAAVKLAKALGVSHRLWTPDFRDRMAVIAERW